MNEHDFRELSAARALHALSPDEEQAFSFALAAHPEWQIIVDEDLSTAAALGEASGGAAPPVALRATLLDAIASLPQGNVAQHAVTSQAEPTLGVASGDEGPNLTEEAEATEAGTAAQRRRHWRAGLFALAASAAVLLALTLTPWMRDSLAPADPVQTALEQVESAPDATLASTTLQGGGQATLHWSPSADQAVFVAEGLPTLDADRDFELWIVRGDQAISLGVVAVDGTHEAAVVPDGFKVGDALAITVEDLGGSPTGAPTSDPIVVVASA